MIFKTLKIKNFMSVGKTRVDLGRRGLTLVTGSNRDNPSMDRNGAGKSTLWDSLSWVLYGKTIRDIPIEKIRNRWTKKGTEVSVLFERSTRVWEIRRTRGVKSNPTLDLFCEGKNVSSGTSTSTQKKIEALLGMDHTTFCTSVIFGQESLRFGRMADKERKAVLEKLLGLDIYEKACAVARQEHAGFRLTLDLHHSSFSHAKEQVEFVLEKIKKAKKKLEEEKEFVNLSAKKINKRLDWIRKWMKKALQKQHVYQTRLEELRHIREKRKDRLNRMGQCKDEFNSFNEQIQEIQAKIFSIKDEKKSRCPTCHQVVKGDNQKKAIKTLENEREEYRQEMLRADRLYKKLSKKIKKGKDDQLEYNEIDRISSKLQTKIYAFDNETNKLHLQISYSKMTPKNTEKTIEDLERELKEAHRKIRKGKKEARWIEKKLNRAHFWVEGFSHHGIRSYLIDEVIPFLNERANYYGRLLNDGRIKIRFRTTETNKEGAELDRLTLIAKNKDGSDIYEGNSVGERQRVDLCVALALKDLARSRSQTQIDLMVFDEVFENLDEAGCERVISLLNQEKDALGPCFVITHNENLKAYFSRRIEMVKENGVSKCQEN